MFPLVPPPLGFRKMPKTFPLGIFQPSGTFVEVFLLGPFAGILPLPLPASALVPQWGSWFCPAPTSFVLGQDQMEGLSEVESHAAGDPTSE
jgi:hypothetical protein